MDEFESKKSTHIRFVNLKCHVRSTKDATTKKQHKSSNDVFCVSREKKSLEERLPYLMSDVKSNWKTWMKENTEQKNIQFQ